MKNEKRKLKKWRLELENEEWEKENQKSKMVIEKWKMGKCNEELRVEKGK